MSDWHWRSTALQAMRASRIPEGQAGRWTVSRHQDWTTLRCATEKNVDPGEVVMCDLLVELLKHMEFIRHAHGRVLVLGLGLGCVVRGLLTRPDVERITLVERSTDVINLVWPHMEHARIELVHAEAEAFLERRAKPYTWDCAWHDLWADDGEDHLALIHTRTLLRLRDRVRGRQGAWNYPRWHRRLMRRIDGLAMV